MSTNNQAPAPSAENPLNVELLRKVWAQLSRYDKSASDLKRRSILRRRWVIILTVISTIASVITGIFTDDVTAFIAIMAAFTLPLIGVSIMNDIVQFTGTTDWIKLRYIAEMMRMNIYQYRKTSGIYATVEDHERDNKLSKAISEVRDNIGWTGKIPFTSPEPRGKEIDEGIKQANKYAKGDDGLSRITMSEYIEWRLLNQRNWYESAINRDFNSFRTFARLSVTALTLGAILSVLIGLLLDTRWAVLVAVANAIAVALSSWGAVGLTGTTYAIFLVTSMKLSDLESEWIAMKDDPDFLANREQKELEFVDAIERLLLWERNEWLEVTIQAQTDADKAILENLSRLTQRAEEAKQLPSEDNEADEPSTPPV